MKTTTILLNANIDSIVARKRDEYSAHCIRIENAYTEANSELPPNVDNNGRLHATCDGYMLPSSRLENCNFAEEYETKIFAKGAFLPNPINDSDELFFFVNERHDNQFKNHVSRLLSGDEIIEAMRDIDTKDKPLNIRFSRSWKRNGETQCYINIYSAFKTINNKITSVIDDYAEEKEMERKAAELAKKALKGDAPTERITVTATVTGLPVYEDYYKGYVTKLMVTLENGSTAFGSLPAKLSDVNIGDVIEMTATFTPKQEDKTHADFKRPSKPSIKERAKTEVVD